MCVDDVGDVSIKHFPRCRCCHIDDIFISSLIHLRLHLNADSFPLLNQTAGPAASRLVTTSLITQIVGSSLRCPGG